MSQSALPCSYPHRRFIIRMWTTRKSKWDTKSTLVVILKHIFNVNSFLLRSDESSHFQKKIIHSHYWPLGRQNVIRIVNWRHDDAYTEATKRPMGVNYWNGKWRRGSKTKWLTRSALQVESRSSRWQWPPQRATLFTNTAYSRKLDGLCSNDFINEEQNIHSDFPPVPLKMFGININALALKETE